MADNLVFEESLNTEIDSSEFISKKWIYVNDNNNSNYTSQVVIDSTPLSNAGGWINWSEGFIIMPLMVQLTGAAAALPADSSISDYSWAFKNGFWNMIDSMTVEFNNQNVVQQTPFLNVFCSFKNLVSWSKDDLLNEGSSVCFYPDSSASWAYKTNFSAASTWDSLGRNVILTNNRNTTVSSSTLEGGGSGLVTNAPLLPVSPTVGFATVDGSSKVKYNGLSDNTTPFVSSSVNDGMLKRQQYITYDADAPASNLGQATLNPAGACESVYRNNKRADTSVHQWRVYAKLRLKDLADFFDKTPLLKGSTMRFYINTNQSKVDFTITQATIVGTSGSLTNAIIEPTNVDVKGGKTCPLMLASNSLGQGASALIDGSYSLSVGIVRNPYAGQQTYASTDNCSLTSCRLYAPVYTFNPIAESKYLSLAPTKRVKYNDIFQYQFTNVTGNFNFLVSNGISNIQSILVVPFISQANTFTDNAGTVKSLLFNQQYNPCSATPAMPDPIMLTNFNILVSGVNLFLNNENYDYEAFCTQLAQSKQLNGGLTTGLSSGLISQTMFSQAYRYYYGNASRHLPSEDGVSRSVQIVGQIASVKDGASANIGVDLMVFVEFQKEVVIDVATGARIE